MIIQFLQTCILSISLWLLWRLFVKKSVLDNIPGPTSKSWKGVFPDIFNPNAWQFHHEIAEKYGSVIKIKAMLGENQLYVFDPKALYHIVVKDQYSYEETSGFLEGSRLLFGHGLLGTLGAQHRKQRKMLNPVFSIAHMREMVPIFHEVTYQFKNTLTRRVENGPQEIDFLGWTARLALELIARSGLGHSFDSLTEDEPPHRYVNSAKQLFPLSSKFLFYRTYFLPALVKIGSPKFRRALLDMMPWKAAHQLRDVTDVLHQTSIEILETKKRALAEGNEAVERQIGEGKDILSILMRANLEASDADRLTDEELLGQMSTLIFAAMDTTSTAISRILHILSANPNAQEKLRQEVIKAKLAEGGDLSHDRLVSLPYLDAMCRETLRLYPPFTTIQRTTRQDIVLPLSKPIKGLNGREMMEIPIPNNTNIIIGIMASNRNPEIWGLDSYEWKPERWLNPLPESVSSAHLPGIYSNLMTFLGGGRACIGFKFSQLEMKVVLSLLVESFRFSLPDDKKIVWKMNTIATPTCQSGNHVDHYQLPLIVELVK